MKSAYLICALLCVTLVLARKDSGTVQSGTLSSIMESPNNSNSESTKGTTAVPITTLTPNTTSTSPNATTAATIPTTTASTTTTTAASTTTIATTTITTTTHAPTTIPTTSTTLKTTSHDPTSPPTSTSTASSKTTAVPPSSKDRQFDGLSFFGGIILTTCLMAIAAFSWKFYRQCKEGNYRTL